MTFDIQLVNRPSGKAKYTEPTLQEIEAGQGANGRVTLAAPGGAFVTGLKRGYSQKSAGAEECEVWVCVGHSVIRDGTLMIGLKR